MSQAQEVAPTLRLARLQTPHSLAHSHESSVGGLCSRDTDPPPKFGRHFRLAAGVFPGAEPWLHARVSLFWNSEPIFTGDKVPEFRGSPFAAASWPFLSADADQHRARGACSVGDAAWHLPSPLADVGKAAWHLPSSFPDVGEPAWHVPSPFPDVGNPSWPLPRPFPDSGKPAWHLPPPFPDVGKTAWHLPPSFPGSGEPACHLAAFSRAQTRNEPSGGPPGSGKIEIGCGGRI